MANITIDDLLLTATSAVTAAHYVAIDNGTTTTKLSALDLTIQSIVPAVAGAELVKSYALGVLTQRALIGGTGITATQNANDITLTVVPGDIDITQLANITNFDLSLANNATSQFLTGPIDLTTGVTGILPVPNGGTGLGTLPDNSVLIGNGTSAIQSILMTTPNSVVVGTATGPEAYTVVGGTNVDIVNDTVANTLTWNFLKGNFVEDGDSPSFVNLAITGNITITGDTSVQDICINDALQMDAQTVTQQTSITTNVTLDKAAGRVRLFTQALAANTGYSFTLNNIYIQQDSVILLTLQSSGTIEDIDVHISVGQIGNGTATIQLNHNGSGTPTADRWIHFLVIQDCTANP